MDGGLALPARTVALKAVLDALPGAAGTPMTASRGSIPIVLIYKVGGKTFAILSARREAFVILKCDPHLAEILREQYVGVGRRSHLDPRRWISVDLESDVPPDEIDRLAARSYELVRGTLTRKQQAELAALPGG